MGSLGCICNGGVTAPAILQPFYAGRKIERAPEKTPSQRGLYHSHLGLFEFQIDGVARTYHQWTVGDGRPKSIFAIWATGTGKTHLAMASTAMLFEDNLIDHVLVVCERDKVSDWARDDYPRYTDLSVDKYMGDPQRRAKLRDNSPQVLVTTYETSRTDICTFRDKKGTPVVSGPGPLTEWAIGRRLCIVYDEATKLRSRSSKTHVAHNYLVNRTLQGSARLLALSAVTIEDDPEDWYNVGRILAPELAGTVASFENDHVKAYSDFGMQRKPIAFKNLTRTDDNPPWDGSTVPLVEKLAPIVIRKRKTDPDVAKHFPSIVENPPTMVDFSGRLLDFYNEVCDTLDREVEKITNPYKAAALSWQAFVTKRQIAGHPLSLLTSNGQLQRAIAETVGEKGLRALGSPKADQTLRWAQRCGSDQGVIFTFFGQSILPMLYQMLVTAGFKVSENHGGLSPSQKAREKDAFVAGDTQFFLSSDCGAKGLNLGMGSVLLHYEMPLLYSTFVQRSNRIHRIDSIHPSVTIDSIIARNTVEDDLTNSLLRRNEWSDKFDLALDESAYDDEDTDPAEKVLTADDRRRVIALARRAA